MKRIFGVISILLITFTFVMAQRNEVVVSAGEFSNANSGSVSWTLGEIVTDTYYSTSILTQGFQQPNAEIVTALAENTVILFAYPNPTQGAVYLNLSEVNGVTYQIVDLRGRVLRKAELSENETEIPFQDLAPALYVLSISRHGKHIQSMKIIKE